MTNKLAQLFDAGTIIREVHALPQWGRLTLQDGMLYRDTTIEREELDGDAEALAVLDRLRAATLDHQWPEQRMDVIGQNDNDGEHYAHMPERLESGFSLEKLREAAALLEQSATPFDRACALIREAAGIDASEPPAPPPSRLLKESAKRQCPSEPCRDTNGCPRGSEWEDCSKAS